MATLVQVVGVWAWVVVVVVAAPHHTPARQLRVSDGTERRGEGLHSLTGISSRGRRHAPLDKDDDEWESSLAPPRKRSAEEQPVSDQPFKREALEVNIGTGILVKGAGTTQRPFNFPQSPTYSPTQPPDLSTQRPIIFPESGPQATPTPPINPTQVPPTIFHSPFFPNDLFPPPGSRPNPSDGSPPKPPSQNPPSQRPSRPSDFFPGQTTPNSHFVPIIPTRRPNIITNTPSLRPVFPNTPPQGSVFPNTPAQGSFFPNTPPQGSVFPNTPPQGSVFPNTPPQGSVFPNTPPQESVFPNTPPQGSIFPNTPPQGSVFPNTPPQGSFFPNTPPQGSVFPNTPSQGPGRFPNTPQRPVGFPIPPNQGPDYIHPTTRRPKFPGFPIPPSPTTRRPCSCRNHTTNINPATPTIPPTTFFSPSPVAPFFPTVAPLFPTVAPQFPTPTSASARPVTPNPGGFRPSFRPTFTPVAGFPVFPNSQSRPVHPNSQHRPVLFIPTNIRSPDVLRVNQRPVSTNGLPRFPAVNGQSFITPHFRLFIPHLPTQGVNQVKNNSDK
ncbi:uncharacterized protein LOC135111991 isoform X2 [Scylla paramamosain]|uniref:uncharacterized protein LOC135111991 isoform X2 n=1 Tax=Scylla paramamosain TaxID=85552 RepID=UPI003082FC69